MSGQLNEIFDEFINDEKAVEKWKEVRKYFSTAQTVNNLGNLKKRLEKQIELGNTKKIPKEIIKFFWKERYKQLDSTQHSDDDKVNKLNAGHDMLISKQQQKAKFDRPNELGPMQI